MTKYHLIHSGGLKLKVFPLLGFKCSSNFRTFAQMLVAHLGNVWHHEFSLQTSSSVKCFFLRWLPTVIVQFKTFIQLRRHPRDSRVESSWPGKNLETSRGKLFLYFYQQRKRQFFIIILNFSTFEQYVCCQLVFYLPSVCFFIYLRGNFFQCHIFAMKSVQNLKSFWRSSQNYFVLALFSRIYSQLPF